MILSKEQIDYINQERKTLNRIIASKPSIGIVRYAARQEALNLIVQLHNVEVENQEMMKKIDQ